MPKNNPESSLVEEQPPVFKTWNQVYIFVLVLHTILITLFYLLTKGYS